MGIWEKAVEFGARRFAGVMPTPLEMTEEEKEEVSALMMYRAEMTEDYLNLLVKNPQYDKTWILGLRGVLLFRVEFEHVLSCCSLHESAMEDIAFLDEIGRREMLSFPMFLELSEVPDLVKEAKLNPSSWWTRPVTDAKLMRLMREDIRI